MSRFRSTAIGCSFLAAALIGIWILAYDPLLRVTQNGHWYVVLAFCVADALLGVQVLLTSALGVWDRMMLRASSVWSLMVVGAVFGDVIVKLQLPVGYPTITVWDAFAYLFLGTNGNPLPLAVPALVTLHTLAALIGLLPRAGAWFHYDWWPTQRTIITIGLVAIVVMGLRPAYIYMNSIGLLPGSIAPNSTSSGIAAPPLERSALPYDPTNRTVFVDLVAVYDVMLPYNFNDTSFGHLVIYIPANWTLTLNFQNREGFPHSAVLMQANAQSPTIIQSTTPVIAQTPHDALDGGFFVNGESGTFTAQDLGTGKYWIVCAFGYPVPHAQEGMWVTLYATSQVTTPYFEVLSD